MKHALLSPSSSHRWLICPGSLAASKGEPNPPSSYSDEGTAAHFLASTVLDTELSQAAEYIGQTIVVWEHPESDSEGCDFAEKIAGSIELVPRSTFEVDDEMAGHVQTYVNRIREYARGHDLFVEQRLSISTVTGEEDAFGTSDAVIIAGNELQIHDLKYGMGIRVDAEDNPQLKIYALAALEEYSLLADFERVRLIIHQPRLDHLSEWDCSVEELIAWSQYVKATAERAMTLYNLHPVHESPGDYQAGEHCKTAFCPARSKCPHLAQHVKDVVGADFDNLEEVKASIGVIKAIPLPTPESLAVLGSKLKAVDTIEDWCKAVRARVESLLLEHSNAEGVTEALGFKLVQGRKGARSWTSVDEAEKQLKAMKLKVEEMYERELKSPTAVEKLLKEQPKKWEKVIPLIVQKDGKPSVAALDDKRPALVITPAIEEFDDLEGSDLV